MSYGGDYTTIRRAWGRWERSTVIGPKMTYTLAYNNYHLTCENCLGTWSGQGMPSSYVLMGYDGKPWTGVGAGTYTNHNVNLPYGIFAMDKEDGDKNAHARLFGSLAYVLSTDTYKPERAVLITALDSVDIEDTVAYIAPGTNPAVLPFGLYGLAGASNLRASDLTAFGGTSSVWAKEWIQSNLWSASSPAAYSSGENIFNSSRGANLCYQYQDGNLTNQPLWPWPMNQRIKDALVQSGRASVDITAAVQGMFGTIPAACLAGGSMAPASPTATPKPPSPTPTPTPGGSLPAPWVDQDIGSPGSSGSASYSAGTFTVKASGTDIWGTSDQFHYVYQPLSGDGTIIARVASIQNTDPWAKTGVMIRATLAANSAFAMMIVTPGNGLAFQRRLAAGGTGASTLGIKVAAPYWVKLKRSGNTFTGYSSPDGVTWTLVGSDTITMSASVYVGLPLTSHNNTLISTAGLGSVTLSSP